MVKADRMADGPGQITMSPAGGTVAVLDPGPGGLGSALSHTEGGSAGILLPQPPDTIHGHPRLRLLDWSATLSGGD